MHRFRDCPVACDLLRALTHEARGATLLPPPMPACPAWPLPYGRYVVFRLLGTRHVSAAQLRLQVQLDPWAMCARREVQLCVVAG